MMKIEDLNVEIIRCTRCPRLVAYTRKVAEEKVRRHREEDYWGRPVPGFGDPDPKILILGLAPAAHGANRTGRMFTGDSSGDWLYRALFETGFANQPESTHANDGLTIEDIYITSTIHCAPPQNKPAASEVQNCSSYFEQELHIFSNLEIILCLGNIAFTRYCRTAGIKGLKFGHHKEYILDNGKMLMSSYHPSRQNTQTGTLLWADWLAVFQALRNMIS